MLLNLHAQVNFMCIGEWVDPKHHVTIQGGLDSITGVSGTDAGGPTGWSGRRYVQSSIDVTKEDVEDYGTDRVYWCECHAWNSVASEGGLQRSAKSRRATVVVACMS